MNHIHLPVLQFWYCIYIYSYMPLLLHICDPYSEPNIFDILYGPASYRSPVVMYVISIVNQLHLSVVVFCIFRIALPLPPLHHCKPVGGLGVTFNAIHFLVFSFYHLLCLNPLGLHQAYTRCVYMWCNVLSGTLLTRWCNMYLLMVT